MKKIIQNTLLLLLAGLLCAGCTLPPPHEDLPLDCGPYPEGYEEIIRGYVTHLLGGPENLKDFVVYKKPERIQIDTYYPQIPLKPLQWVWETSILYNEKNKAGKDIGKRLHVAWIRYDHLVAFDYNMVELDYFHKIRTDDIRKKLNGQ
jgi:hypothetical protein